MPTRHQGSEKEKRALDALIKLSRASDSVASRVGRCFGGSNVSLSQFGVLDALYHCGPLPLGEIARKHLKSPNNITTLVDAMERRGLVERERDERDRRIVRARLTDCGRQTFERLWEPHLRAVVETFGFLSDEEQRTLAALCRKLGLACQAEGESCPPNAEASEPA